MCVCVCVRVCACVYVFASGWECLCACCLGHPSRMHLLRETSGARVRVDDNPQVAPTERMRGARVPDTITIHFALGILRRRLMLPPSPYATEPPAAGGSCYVPRCLMSHARAQRSRQRKRRRLGSPTRSRLTSPSESYVANPCATECRRSRQRPGGFHMRMRCRACRRSRQRKRQRLMPK